MAEEAEGISKGILSRFTTKIGPLPLWAWTGIPAGAYIAYAYWKRSKEPTQLPIVAEDALEGDEGAAPINTGLPSVGSGVSIPGYQAAPDGSSNLPQTNDAWYFKALSYMTGQGVNPAEAGKALGSYIYGVPATVTQAQLDIINDAIKKVGAPPQYAAIPSVASGTAQTTDPTPAGAPKTPSGFRYTGFGQSGKAITVNLTWNAAVGAEGPVSQYIVEREHVGNPGVWARNVVAGTATSTTVTTAVFKGKEAQYRFRIAAVNAKGQSPYVTIGPITVK